MLNYDYIYIYAKRSFRKWGSIHYDAGNLILILMFAWHMGCRWYTLDVDVITVSI